MLKSLKGQSFAIEIAILFSLLLGVFSGYWNVGSTLFFLCYEIVVFILLAFVNSFAFSSKIQPGPLVFGGLIIVIISFIPSFLISIETGDFVKSDDRTDSEVWRFILSNIKSLWPVLTISLVGLTLNIIRIAKHEKDDALADQLFFSIFSVLGILLFSSILMWQLNSSSKIIVLVAVIIVRILLEFYLNKSILGFQRK